MPTDLSLFSFVFELRSFLRRSLFILENPLLLFTLTVIREKQECPHTARLGETQRARTINAADLGAIRALLLFSNYGPNRANSISAECCVNSKVHK